MELNQKKIKLLIVDDSMVFCQLLVVQLPRINPRLQVIGYAMNAYDALKKANELHPDVISLDVEMPGMSGLDFLQQLIPRSPIPVVLVSSLNVSVFDALSYGAVDFVKKPDMSKNYNTQTFIQALASKLVIASSATVNVSCINRRLSSTSVRSGCVSTISSQPEPLRSTQSLTCSSLKIKDTIIAIGASTGGTEATLEVLKKLPKEMPGIVITQHMPEGFTQMYASRLDRLCAMDVKEAANGDQVRPGLALIAPGGEKHMKVVKKGIHYYVQCVPGSKVNGHRPSVDVLFSSVANAAKSNAVGIILTGMGSDGAQGLLEMRQNGGYTIGQDKNSCVVYGMPMVAERIGAVCTQAACSNIANTLIKHLNS